MLPPKPFVWSEGLDAFRFFFKRYNVGKKLIIIAMERLTKRTKTNDRAWITAASSFVLIVKTSCLLEDRL